MDLDEICYLNGKLTGKGVRYWKLYIKNIYNI